MNNDQLYFYNRGFNDCLAKFVDTHPVKEQLTDEEICDVFEGCLFEGGFNKYEFARAILRKAQEK
jgi:hypothetical protein